MKTDGLTRKIRKRPDSTDNIRKSVQIVVNMMPDVLSVQAGELFVHMSTTWFSRQSMNRF